MAGLNLDSEQLDRYSRHIIMDDVGPEGQRALLDSTALVVGAGGLGAPVIQYLAAAGVGTIHVVDDDEVERSNLQRQVLHRDADIGRPKAESAKEFVAELNPDVECVAHEVRLDPDNVHELIDGVDFVVDCADNFPTRYLVNDACVIDGVPYSHGAIYRFEGQATTFPMTEDSPCYRCLFPEAPPEGTIPDCATAGVLGVLPGTMGCIQATECVKSLMGVGDLLDGRLLFYHAKTMEFDTITLKRSPDCPVCGDDPDITSVQDVEYTGACSVRAASSDD
jgi:adenylyltransferase/sulfurtransferase